FLVAAAMLNRLSLLLAPVALAVIWGYSYTKRFTPWSHLVLGVGLGIAPTGAWIAVRGQLAAAPLLLTAAVALWGAGFDIIYATQDVEFDRQIGLFSLPSRLGVAPALCVSRLMHVGTVILLAGAGIAAGAGATYFVGVALVAALLLWEQSLVRPADLSRV